jgi:hypothetical protein
MRGMTCRRFRFAMGLMCALAALPALAQAGAGQPQGRPRYNPSTETTVKGTIQEVQQRTRGAWTGTHVILKTEQGTLDVHLGPSDFLAKQHLTLSSGDRIEVTGSKVNIGQAEELLARTVKKGDKVFTLRNERGIPEWSRGRRR